MLQEKIIYKIKRTPKSKSKKNHNPIHSSVSIASLTCLVRAQKRFHFFRLYTSFEPTLNKKSFSMSLHWDIKKMEHSLVLSVAPRVPSSTSSNLKSCGSEFSSRTDLQQLLSSGQTLGAKHLLFILPTLGYICKTSASKADVSSQHCSKQRMKSWLSTTYQKQSRFCHRRLSLGNRRTIKAAP